MNNKLIGRTIAIGVIILFAGASIAAGTNTDSPESVSRTSTFGNLQDDWYEDFDNYTLGQYLENESDPADGGWHGWDSNPAAGAYVVDVQAHSSPHSVEVVDQTDLVHEYEGYTSGQWVYTAWQYIPSDLIGQTYFIMLNTYEDGGDKNWALQIGFNGVTDLLTSEFEGLTLPIIYDQWVEIRVEIDLDADLQTVYYGGDYLTDKSWKDGVSGGGAQNIACVDLWGNSASAVYYDDFSLVGEGGGEQPELEISDITGGFGISAMIDNVGDGEATDTEWSITLDGGLIILGKETTGTIASIPAGESSEIKSGLIFGIGRPTITITAECAEGKSAEETASGLVILFFVLGVS
jgi:hypothetical protein